MQRSEFADQDSRKMATRQTRASSYAKRAGDKITAQFFFDIKILTSQNHQRWPKDHDLP